MIELLEKLFRGHVHKWNIIATPPVNRYGAKVGSIIILQCEHCGNIKEKKVGYV